MSKLTVVTRFTYKIQLRKGILLPFRLRELHITGQSGYRMKKSILLFLLLVFGTAAQAQNKLDSLHAALRVSGHDTSRVNLLDQLSFRYSRIDPDKGLEYAQQALDAAEELGWKKGIAAAHSDFGINYEAKGIHSLAVYYHEKALRSYTELGMKGSMAAVLANLSTVYEKQGDYPNALSYAHEAMEISESIGDTAKMAFIWENIGIIYLRQKNYDQAMQNYITALHMHERMGNDNGVVRVLGNIGIVYDATGKYEQALDCHMRALEVNRSNGDKYGEQVNLMNIGLVHCHMKKYSLALNYQLQALRISQESGGKGDVAVNLGNIGETHYFMATDSTYAHDRTKSLHTAIAYLLEAVALCEEINYLGPLIEFRQFLSDAYLLAGDHAKALAVYKEMAAVKDSIAAEEQSGKIKDLEAKREFLLKEKELEIHNKQLQIAELTAANKRNERIIFISGIILLLALITIIVLRYRTRVKAHREVLSDIANIQSHELRGPIARMQGLVNLLRTDDLSDPDKLIVGYIRDVSIELDEIVRKASAKATQEALSLDKRRKD